VLEAVVRPWPVALNEKDVGLGEPLQGRPEFGLGEAGDRLEKRLREVAPEYGADLRDLPSGAEPVKPGGERLLQSRRDRRRAPLDAAFQEEARYLFDEQGHAAAAFAHPFNDLLGQHMTRGDLGDHARDLRAIEWGQRDYAMMRAQAPGRAKLQGAWSR